MTTTFASTYKARVSLEDMLTREAVLDYRLMKTGEKYLVTPKGYCVTGEFAGDTNLCHSLLTGIHALLLNNLE